MGMELLLFDKRTNKKGTSRLGTGDGSLDVLAQGAGWCLQSTQLQTTDAPSLCSKEGALAKFREHQAAACT